MFLAACGDGIGEKCETAVIPGGVLDFDIDRFLPAFEQKIHPTFLLAVGDFGPHGGIITQFREYTLFKGIADHPIR